MNTTKSRRREPVKDDYLELVQKFRLRPIRSAQEHAEAMKVYLPLVAKTTREPPALSPGESDYLDALDNFVRQYEAPALAKLRKGSTPLSLLKQLMEEAGMKSSDLGEIVGSRPAASMILKGKRAISKSQAKALAERFKVDAGLFL
jgi:HTH-type transcriptional regulator/antitoxin HigA